MTFSKEQRDASQADKFRRAAEEHQCDPAECRWEERLKNVAKQKPGDPK